ncbi:hypothetical protein ACJMK2_026043 [Sinanodonta woodiana]|uniref:Ig-like domain-containing protein n=1 Tax=Sinanodonta woodiana TaxID=1069815 RepID=A0ABD3XM50_SINWO
MSTSSIITVFTFLTYFTVCNTDPLLGFTGCNATLQWDMSNISYEQERTDFRIIRIIDNAGDVIATKESDQCMSKNNLSMNCRLSDKNDDLLILLTLINITTNHTGNYTAWFKKDLHFENKTTPLIVIDKPRIMEVRKPVLNHKFTVTCTTSYIADCITYYWKINGSDLQDSINIHASMSNLTYRNVTMMDNFSTLTCRAGIDKCSNRLCNSSEDSDPYTVKPYYGPLYVYLSLNESLVYLEENITFKVKCSASCYPPCTFRWESYYLNVDNEELVIHNFNKRLSGGYTCTATNRETGVTANSYLLVIHAKGYREVLLWIGPVFFVAAFVIFVTVWRIKASREIGQFHVAEPDNVNTNTQPLISLQRRHDGSKLQEDPYHIIDENVLTVYDYSTYNANEEISQETDRRPELCINYYANSLDTYTVEAANVHASDESYLNPISDLIKTYITIIDDFSHPVEEANVTEADPTYITPITGSQ